MRVTRDVMRIAGLVLIPGVLCMALGCCQQQAGDPPATEGITDLRERSLAIWNEGNLDLVDELYAPGYVRHFVNMDEDVVGLDAFKEEITEFLTGFPDLFVTLDEIIVSSDKVAFRWTLTGTNTGPLDELPATGRSVQVSGVVISHLVDGKVVEDWLYYNQGALLQQLGFALVPPTFEAEE